MSVGLFIMAPLGGYLAKHFKPKRIVQVGFIINVLALLYLRQSIAVTASVSSLIAPLLLYGIGMGLVFSQVTNITLSAVSPSEAGEASGVNNTLRQVGQSLGTALIGTILVASIGSGLVDGVNNSSVISEQHRPALAQAVSAQSSNIEFGIPLQGTSLSPDEAKELKRIANESTVKANKQSLLFTAAFTIGALALASQLPSVGLSGLEKDESLATKSTAAH